MPPRGPTARTGPAIIAMVVVFAPSTDLSITTRPAVERTPGASAAELRATLPLASTA